MTPNILAGLEAIVPVLPLHCSSVYLHGVTFQSAQCERQFALFRDAVTYTACNGGLLSARGRKIQPCYPATALPREQSDKHV
jgi:hypothetical protein